MTSDQEQQIVNVAKNIEQLAKSFVVGIQLDEQQRKWFTPTSLLLKALRITASTSGPEIKGLAIVLYGSIDLLGFAGTVRLILDLRRVYAGKKSAKQQTKRT